MLRTYHEQICTQAFGNIFKARALKTIIRANLAQDGIRGQIGHPEYHVDDNKLDESQSYMEKQRGLIWETLRSKGNRRYAWQAFGRLTHTLQDFYAHTNYITLWADSLKSDHLPTPNLVDPMNPEILRHPQLQSGMIYLWDWLAFIPGLYNFALQFSPEDSHTHMNLDSPDQGPLFPYAFQAAIKRSFCEYQMIVRSLDNPLIRWFNGSQTGIF
jgi:hypothetical protein